MKRMLLTTVLLAVGAALAAPRPARAQMPGPLVTADWLAGHLTSPDVAVLHADMRRPGYDEGHVPGARFLDMSLLVWDGDPAWGAEMRTAAEIQEALRAVGVAERLHHVVVYADNPLFAARAFMTLEVMGLKGRVHVLDGGLGGWKEDGRALSTVEPAVQRGDVTVHPVDDVLVRAEWIAQRLDDDRIALVDARPDDEYTGADGGMGGTAHAGHIPGAHQLYWEDLISSRQIPRLLPSERARALFEAAGAARGDTVVTYCMVGWRASYTYLVARTLGYDTKFYDGSWHDWGTRDDLPYVSGTSPR